MRHLLNILLAVAATVILVVSCVDPLEPAPDVQVNYSDGAILFNPEVLGVTPATKTEGEDALGENTLTRIDVYVYRTKANGIAEDNPVFVKHYTILPEGEATTLDSEREYLLESNWRSAVNDADEGEETYKIYKENNTYSVYAIANAEDLPDKPTEENLIKFCLESEKSIKGENDYDCYDIVRLKSAADPTDVREHRMSNKVFLMDGKNKNWTIDVNSPKQYFYTTISGNDKLFELSRAAAKFSVTLQFASNDDFIERFGTPDATGLKYTKTTYYDAAKEHRKSVQIITIGSLENANTLEEAQNSIVLGGPILKFANYMKSTYVIAPEGESPSADEQIAFRNNNLWDCQSFFNFSDRTSYSIGDGDAAIKLFKFPYKDISYSYSFIWSTNEAAEKSPALAVSIRYTTYTQKFKEDGTKDGGLISDGGVTNYYRIPLVNLKKTTAIQRNYFYQVVATINTMGTSTSEIEPVDVALNYKVVPWPIEPDETTQAQSTQLLYFVAETSYRLRGDEPQTKYLQYFTPLSDPDVTVDGITYYKATPKISNVVIYYKDQNGQTVPVADPATTNDGYTWEYQKNNDTYGENVLIKIIPDRTGSGGNIQVTSSALTNRSVKYITFDATVDFDYAGGQPVTRHFTVTHFPLDNLQSISGKWSSYWNHESTSGSVTEYTFDLEVAKSWGNYQTDNNYEVTSADPYTRSEKVYVRRNESYDGYEDSTIERGDFINNVPQNNRADANSRGNAHEVNNNGYYYYWGANPVQVNNNQTYDYSTTFWIIIVPVTRYYIYSSYHVTRYYKRHYYRTRYSRTVTINYPSTGNWVDWDKCYNSNNNSFTINNNTVTSNNLFYAQFYGKYYGRTNYCWLYSDRDVQEQNHLPNNHMYVIQVSKAGKDKYGNEVIIGRPNLTQLHQSDDNTVSPAFMIASQLGATQYTTYTQNNAIYAATHCYNYMEVAENGHRFTGWRLPTQAEIQYILQYQKDLENTLVFDEVLGGHYYYTLNENEDGERRAETENDLNLPRTYIRCIRDLTPAEVIDLNNNGTISASNYSN